MTAELGEAIVMTATALVLVLMLAAVILSLLPACDRKDPAIEDCFMLDDEGL